ncbi:DNA glycosylase [Cylindrobasidium torrendii FP15055 ss-10]|uniref:DNA glycosylase n=1 Tax=Cylindrobasidium torrendii FP15055 ss-10 TaxID=1314674 RepID=A0A0D7BFW2_9AGAR|nr:DNA glycosylase [Cylindrobasidium torrendii FP15055 ss-10]
MSNSEENVVKALPNAAIKSEPEPCDVPILVRRRSQRSPEKPRQKYFDSDSDEPSELDKKKRKKKPNSSSRTAMRSPAKKARTDPETYAHLHGLPDHLRYELDILFCGINPGVVSATVGHHYGHATNHFYKCLHSSGLTPGDAPLLPVEDVTLPERFNFGLTNLGDRPTPTQGDLSNDELKAGVTPLMRKVAFYRPRIVAFVGITMAKIAFQAATGKPAKIVDNPGLMPFKMVHGAGNGNVEETLFFVTPSTSGRVTQFQLPDKIAVFAELKARLKTAKDGTLDTGHFAVIHPPTMAPLNNTILPVKSISNFLRPLDVAPTTSVATVIPDGPVVKCEEVEEDTES